MLSDLSTYLRYTTALPGFLRRRLGSEEAERLIRDALANRESSFLRIVERGIYGRPQSPYLRLPRREPMPTASAKVLALHLQRTGSPAAGEDAA